MKLNDKNEAILPDGSRIQAKSKAEITIILKTKIKPRVRKRLTQRQAKA